jgi:hypothetical protein
VRPKLVWRLIRNRAGALALTISVVQGVRVRSPTGGCTSAENGEPCAGIKRIIG